MDYIGLTSEAEKDGIEILEHKFKNDKLKGLYCDGSIILNNNNAISETEKKCILAEELGHYHTSFGDILNQDNIINIKQEKRARNWAFEKLVPVKRFIDGYKAGVRNRNELAQYLDVTEEFLDKVIEHYRERHGL